MSGMTLLETLLVMLLITVITMAGGFGLAQLQTQFQLRGTGDEIRSQLQYGRELAIANKGWSGYRIKSINGLVVLVSDGRELSRVTIPRGMNMSPPVFDWGFAPVTGQLSGCALPCSLGLSLKGSSETVIIQSNGIVY